MTPKLKAKTLINEMYNIRGIDWDMAVNCALIAADEILKFEESIIIQLDKITKNANGEFKVESKYWQEVKQEINKL